MTATRRNKLARSSSSPPHAAVTWRVRPVPQKWVDGLGPHPEGGGHAERVGPGEHASRLRVAGEQFPAQPALPTPASPDSRTTRNSPAAARRLVLQRRHLLARPTNGIWRLGIGPGRQRGGGRPRSEASRISAMCASVTCSPRSARAAAICSEQPGLAETSSGASRPAPPAPCARPAHSRRRAAAGCTPRPSRSRSRRRAARSGSGPGSRAAARGAAW